MELRNYLTILWRWKWLIILATVLAAAGAYGAMLFQPTLYESTALLASTKFEVRVDLESQIQTLGEEELGSLAYISRVARLTGFAAIARNPEIAEQVVSQFADRLASIDANLTDPALFAEKRVACELMRNTDVLALKVTLEDPELAAEIATAWAEQLEQQINTVYSAVTQEMLSATETLAEDAYQAYQDAQAELGLFMADNAIPLLAQEINVLSAQVNTYKNAFREGGALVGGDELSARLALLEGYYGDLVRLNRLADNARALLQQVASGNASQAGAMGDSLALMFMRAEAYSSFGDRVWRSESAEGEAENPYAIQLQMPFNMGVESITAVDVENLITVIETRIAETETKIEESAFSLLDPPSVQSEEGAGAELLETIDRLTDEIQLYQAQLDAEQQRESELKARRDLAWEIYSMLSRKVAEVSLESRSGIAEVRLASPARPPSSPSSPRRLMSTALAAVVGLMFGVGGAFFLDYLADEETLDAFRSAGKKRGKKTRAK
jgi:uncharacterized protein involved in exopolysaccharide biosynthesis